MVLAIISPSKPFLVLKSVKFKDISLKFLGGGTGEKNILTYLIILSIVESRPTVQSGEEDSRVE